MAWKLKKGIRWVVYDRMPGRKTPKYFGTFPFASLADKKIAELKLLKIRNKHRMADYSATFWSYCDMYEALPDAERKKGTRRIIHTALALAKQFFDEAKKVVDITLTDVRAYITWLRRDYNHTTTHMQMRNFSSVLNLAVKDKIIDENPAKEPLRRMGKPEGRRIVLSIEQEEQLFDAALRLKMRKPARNGTLWRMIKTLYATGVRQAELLNMRKEDMISPTQIEIPPVEEDDVQGAQPTKSDTPYIVELNFEIAPWFAEVQSGQIFTGWTKDSFYHQFKRCVKLANLPPKLSPHGMRHTFAKDALQTGTTLRELKDMMNHKSLETTLRYARYERKKLKQNVDAMVRQPRLEVV